MTDDAAKPKITARATDRDPFGLDDFTKGALGEWFPGGVVPPSGVPGSVAPVVPQPTSGLLAPQGAPGAGTLGTYRKMQETEGAREAAAARPPLPPSVATSPIVHPQGGGAGAASVPPVAPAWSPPPAPPPPTAADLIAGEMKLQLLRGMFPQHSITPVEYDPWKAVPTGLGAKVNVNEGIA